MYNPASDEEALEIYRKLSLIRQVEEAIIRDYYDDEMKTPVHLGIGLEGISVGVTHGLPADTRYFGHYRNHGQYLAITNETDEFFGELYGRDNGTAGGRSGSMCLSSPKHGIISNSGIVGSSIALAVGSGLAAKYSGTNQLTISAFGDGATEEGEFWESLNFACLHGLRVLFICEDNDLAIYTPASERRGFKSVIDPAKGFDCYAYEGDGADVLEVLELTQQALTAMNQDPKPALIRFKWHRITDHVGTNYDVDVDFRPRPTNDYLLDVDPVHIYECYLQTRGIDADALESIRSVNQSRIESSIKKAQSAGFQGEQDLYTGLLA